MALADEPARAAEKRSPELPVQTEVRRIEQRTDRLFGLFITLVLLTLALVLLAMLLQPKI